ncbi:MAG: DUF1194 domain-containing protein [Rhodobacteraceae bacterium]|nr:DUF1194 domain-containing protein [Paracoccaceae bacterium]
MRPFETRFSTTEYCSNKIGRGRTRDVKQTHLALICPMFQTRLRLLIRLLLVLVSVGALSSAPHSLRAEAQRVVNLELVLLIDVSASVDDREYALQAKGLGAAFADPNVLNAIQSIARGGMAVSVIQWANCENQKRAIDWTLLRNKEDALAFAAQLLSMPRLIHGGHTAIGDALAFAGADLGANGYAGLRRVIDVSGDGRSNDGNSLSKAREMVLSDGIVINALAILNEIPLLGNYFRDHLIGGAGAFLITAADYTDFARAIRLKLEQEIRAAPVANKSVPESGRKQATAWTR